jgi:hypothetical protein
MWTARITKVTPGSHVYHPSDVIFRQNLDPPLHIVSNCLSICFVVFPLQEEKNWRNYATWFVKVIIPELTACFGGFVYFVYRRLPAGRRRYSPWLAARDTLSRWIFFILPIFRIIVLAEKSRKIFEFKGLICKIFRGKDLGRFYLPVVAGRRSTNCNEERWCSEICRPSAAKAAMKTWLLRHG